MWPWDRGAPKILGCPKIFLQRLKLATLKLECGWGLPSLTIKSERKTGRGLQEFSNIVMFPFNICATAEASNFKFGMHLSFAKAHHKTTPSGKVSVVLG